MDSNPQLQSIEIKNEGQRKIQQIRQEFFQSSLAVADNPAPEIQQMLNKPVQINPSLYQADPKDVSFLEDLIKKISSGEIHLYTPSTLLNQPVYQKSAAQIQAKADYDILTLLHKIRQIKNLWDAGDRQSYQIMNLVHSLRLTKENLESLQGDIFII